MVSGTGAVVVAQSQAPSTAPAIAVVAHDQYFSGLPTSIPAGSRLSMSNAGTEVHQMVVARRVDGVTMTWDELLADPDPVGAGLVTLAGQLFAAPGLDASGAIMLDEPGDYFAVCFVPQGITVIPDPKATEDPDASTAPLGPAHYLLGMRQDFTVTAPGSTPGPLPTATPAAASASSAPTDPSTAP